MILKIILSFILLVIFSGLVFGISTITPAFGQIANEIDITPGAGAAVTATCVAAHNCFTPNQLYISSGTTVTWRNTDTVSHYVTSGYPSDNATGTVFDSGNLIRPGDTYQFTFANAGAYNYFDTIHPWMTGIVIVNAGSSQSTTSTLPSTSQTRYCQPGYSLATNGLCYSTTPVCNQGYFLANNLCYPYLHPSLSLQTPIVNGLTITIDGIAKPLTYGSVISRITWDWGDGQNIIGWTPQSHTYSQAGSYNVIVRAYDNFGFWEQTVQPVTVQNYVSPPTPQSNPTITPQPYTINVQTDAASYTQGSPVTISAYPYNAQLGQNITILVTDSSSNVVTTQTVSVNSNGNAIIKIELPADARTGTYTVSASMSSNGNYQQGSAQFTISSQISSPSATQPDQSTSETPWGAITTNSNQYVISNGSPTVVNVSGHIFNSNGGFVNISVKSPNGENTPVLYIPVSGGDFKSSFDLGLVSQFSESGTYTLIGTYSNVDLESSAFTVTVQDQLQSPNSTSTQTNTQSETNQQTSIPQQDTVNTNSSDGLLTVSLNYVFNEDNTDNKSVRWWIFFEDHNGQQIPHSNYAISVMQDGHKLLDQTADYAITGGAGGQISNLGSFDPIGIKVTYLGVGLQYADSSTWTGPKGDIFYLEIPKITSNNQPVASVMISTDKKSYNEKDLVTVSGTVSDSTSGDSVALELTDPSGGITQLQSVKIENDKTFSLLFAADDSIWKGAGTYTIKAIYGNNLPSTTSFELNQAKTCFMFWCW